jgi:hypothetical protein
VGSATRAARETRARSPALHLHGRGRKSVMRFEPSNKRESGIAVLLMLLLLSFMLAVVMANSQALFQLKREVKLLDTRQKKRWAALDAAATNKPVALPSAPIAK